MLCLKKELILQKFFNMINIAIFGSGSGTNAENIIRFYEKNETVNVALMVANTPKSRFKEIAKNHDIAYELIDNFTFQNAPEQIVESLKAKQIDWIILAGFLRKIHPELIRAFSNRMINIHPSLLPKYGGKGMYGMNVHQAVLDNKEKESGITVHFVNENFDEGKILKQEKIDVSNCTSADEIRQKVQELEH